MAREFAAAGADIAINWLDDEGAAQRVADQVRASGRRATLLRADVSQLEQVKTMVSAAQEGLGSIDVLINNAAVFPRVPFLEMTEHDWDQVLDVNLKGTVRRQSDGRRRAEGSDHQYNIGCRTAWLTARRALCGQQGWCVVIDAGDGIGACSLPYQGQCDRG